MTVANELDYLRNYLIESKASWLRIHFIFSAEFTSLHESDLVSILKRDDLQMRELEIWDYVIKWGTAQNPRNWKNESKEGFAPRAFWNICNEHANTIVVIKIEGTNEVIGGFNPLAWDKTKNDWIKQLRVLYFHLKMVLSKIQFLVE
ncbi:hypothetical protein Glove_750g43 [Diversispora epigaea]|uniref:BACK domain-containing protein n=1 Tax=Diversispora epigaea TaxID=1348612 RepID=A0A397G5Q7_9GLOM|nr:hypothetical protein Glove_750g43 [Diversispora epigaea]